MFDCVRQDSQRCPGRHQPVMLVWSPKSRFHTPPRARAVAPLSQAALSHPRLYLPTAQPSPGT